MTVAVLVHADPGAAARVAARRFIELGRSAIAERDRFCAALAGGSTPMKMYALLAATRLPTLDWQRVHVFFSDERCVPADHPHSNCAMVRRALLDRVALPAAHVHRIECEAMPGTLAAERYEAELRAFFGSGPPPHVAGFDLILLGVGADGHTASLFPGAPALAERQRWVAHTRAPPGVVAPERISLTLPALNAARRIIFLVTGATKAGAVGAVLNDPERCAAPAAMVRGAENLEWHLDAAAAGLLRSGVAPAPTS